LDGEPEAVVLAAACVDQVAVVRVEMEVAWSGSPVYRP